MPDHVVKSISLPTAAESPGQRKPIDQSETTLKDVLDAMYDSDVLQRTGKDVPSRFWSAYERVAKQHDDEFLDRHNGELDVLLIFAGLFSAVSSAFIVNMESSLSPNPSDTTNSLLKILINKIDNNTFPPQEVALPVWNGPSSTSIWIQTLAYTSLSTSLLAAFGAVLGKQWLGHFKTTRFGRGTLQERCQRRQQKLDGLEAWHFSTIIATLPIFLQLSLLFFGTALSANIWIQEHTVASVIMATTTFGLIFYFFTVVASLKSPDCPFQTPVSTVLQSFRDAVRKKGDERPKSWAGFLDRLLVLIEGTGTIKRIITKSISRFVTYLWRFPAALGHRSRSMANDSEAGRGSEQSGPQSDADVAGEMPTSLEQLDLDSPIKLAEDYAVQSSAVQWILATSTDTDTVTTAARMLPEIEWPVGNDVTGVLDRLKSHFYACFDPTRQVLPQSQARAVACLKAMCHLDVERELPLPFLFFNWGRIFSNFDGKVYNIRPDQDSLVVSCAVGRPEVSDITSLSVSDRTWMAHMFTYHLHNKLHDLYFITFVIDFIETCLDSMPPQRLLADCLLLAGMLLGLSVNRQHLARLDKSKAIGALRQSVMSRTLGVLVSDLPTSPEHKWRGYALKLLRPLLEEFLANKGYSHDHRLSEWCFKLCLCLLEGVNTPTEDTMPSVGFKRVATLIRYNVRNPFPNPKDWFTQAHLDLLVDYHLRICQGSDYDAVKQTFTVLTWLRGSPSTQDRKYRYIDTTIRFMDQKITRSSALLAASSVPTVLASVDGDDESLRERFSKALASAIMQSDSRADATLQAPLDHNPFKDITFFRWRQDVIPYLRLLCALSQEPAWQLQLHRNGHFDNCLVIADTLSAQEEEELDEYAAHVAHILGNIDASGDAHPFYASVQAYPSWPLILRAWKLIFSINFFGRTIVIDWKIMPTNHIEVIPSLIMFSRKRCEGNEDLILLIDQVCQKLDEEKQQHDRDKAQGIQPSGRRESQVLAQKVKVLLESAQRDV